MTIYPIKNSWFYSLYELFLNQKQKLMINADGIHLFADENTMRFSWSQLSAPIVFSRSCLGETVCFNIDGTRYRLPYLAYGTKRLFAPNARSSWIKANKGRLFSLIEQIELGVEKRYLRHSLVLGIKQAVATECERWLPWAITAKLDDELQHRLNKLITLSQWSTQTIVDLQQSYIAKQLIRFEDFFDSIESKPLTDKQRRACIIDDDNNLLLAGAGTGKTSVMVGRATYLVASNQAVADDILLLAYGKEAANEMEQRITAKLGANTIKATTFHSLGMTIIAAVEGEKPSLSPWSSDDKAKNKWIDLTIESLLKQRVYRQTLFDYFSHYYYIEKNDFDFDSMGEYLDYLKANEIRSLKGDEVKSFGELYIANFLFNMGIEYQYEAAYQHKVSSLDFRQYKPDFYLPEYDLYIEYYGVDEHGNTAAYIDQDKYQASQQWKTGIHEQYNSQVINLYYYQHRDNELLTLLAKQLTSFGVNYQVLPDQARLATLRELGRVTELAKLFGQLIGVYKAAYLDEKATKNAINNSADPKQSQIVFTLLEPILESYHYYLNKQQHIDFEDMIAKALAYIEQGRFSSPWTYIMVDEFQDISPSRARLVKALRDSNAKSSLFCVGDDWQAIYRFSGADVSLTTQFADYFGHTATSVLDLSFRFNNRIAELATQFVCQNPVQIKKDITALSTVEYSAVSILMTTQTSTQAVEPLRQILDAIAGENRTSSTVYLLARFWFSLPNTQQLQQLNKHYSNLEIKSHSIHGSKGKEADYVVLLGMTKGKHGFPSAKAAQPLFNTFLPQVEHYKFAEERRLFYVALTRARHRVYIVAETRSCSEFVSELIDGQYDVVINEFDSSYRHDLVAEINCMSCHSGSLIERRGKFGKFFSCSNSPLCDHKEKGCQQCGSVMSRQKINGFKACINEQCGHTAPLCELCGGEMILRQSRRGEFWGCGNYRGKESPSCGNTKTTDEIRVAA